MSALQIDTDGSIAASRTWVEWGDDTYRSQLDLAFDLASMRLGDADPAACQSLAAAATDLWTASVFLRLVVDRVLAADASGASAGFDDRSVAQLVRLAGGRVATVVDVFTAWSPPGFAPLGGDVMGTYSAEVRSPYLLRGRTAVDLGRELVLRALDDAGSEAQIRADEFEFVRMSDGRCLVVLPGVTDLSSLDLGLNATNRSVRDVDEHAYPSSRSSSVDDNAYAQMVERALAIRGVPVGSELVIVGHSYGADTALDLAADRDFNGPGGYRVTHVVAAAYHSEPQLEHVPGTTEVLVLQNRRDPVIVAEAVGAAHVTDAVESRADLFVDLATFDLPGVVLDSARTIYHDIGIASAAIGHTIDRADAVLDAAIAVSTNDYRRAIDAAADFVTFEPGVSTPRPGQVVAVFDGEREGFGHHPHNYTAYLDRSTDPAVTAFLVSLGSASTATVGTAYGVDVSVPASQ